jgi:hypothetical protein
MWGNSTIDTTSIYRLLKGGNSRAGLHLDEAERTQTTPQKLIAQGTDWRFLNELKRELKA